MVTPSWIAPAIVITLLVEPGSYTSVTGRFFSAEVAACAGSVSVAPSTVAMARMSPVCTSTTIAMPPSAFIERDTLQERLLGLPLQRRRRS